MVGDLELKVLTDSDIRHTTALYIFTSEVVQFRSNISPIVSLVNSLRDHKCEPVWSPGLSGTLGHISTGVNISPTTQIYFRDVEDHCVLIMDSIDQMRRLADNMIDLIFNTNSSQQNESIKQLTLVTILFLPLNFLSSYFGETPLDTHPSLYGLMLTFKRQSGMNFVDFTGRHCPTL